MQSVTQQQWRSVPGYTGILEASSDGQIRTVDQVRTSKRGTPIHRRGKLLSQSIGAGRPIVYFRDLNSKIHGVSVANVIASTFLRPLQGTEVVRWKDGDRRNCDASNLEIITKSQSLMGIPKKKRCATCN